LGFSGNDLKGEDILGEIYEKELQKTSFWITKVLQRNIVFKWKLD
jgi:hypothetical protein